MGKTRDLFKKIKDIKGIFHAKMGTMKDRNGMDLTEVDNTKKSWNDEALDVKTRCMLTVTAIMAQGLVTDALKHHIMNAKANGVTKEEMASLITHAAFYAGWPKAWATFGLAKDVYGEA